MPFSLSPRSKLLLVSFESIFLELVVIRWLSSEVRVFAYFKNLPLFAAFLGLGAGFIIAPKSRNYFRYTPFLLLLTVLVIGLAPQLGYTHIVFTDPFDHYLLGAWGQVGLATMLGGLGLLAGIFVLIVLLFAAVGEKVGELLNADSPITAYSLNIAAGLGGVVLFALLSHMRCGPAVWVIVTVVPLVPLLDRFGNAIAAVVCIVVFFLPAATAWSPYYRIDLEPVSARLANGNPILLGYTVKVNHDGILGAYNFSDSFVQRLSESSRFQLLDYYNVPYRIFGNRFRNVLVLGAGAGNDVAAALGHGATHVDAVEIDPGIIDIGIKYHPEKPYNSKAVSAYVADARAFLGDNSHANYDLIVLGELDSHTVLSSMSSVRLDNYVYTVESFQQSLRRLAPNGVLALSFYYYRDWQMARVYDGLWKASGEKPPVVRSLGQFSGNLVMFAGPGASRSVLENDPYVRAHNAEDMVGNGSVEPTTDDWPFLYLRRRGLPSGYFSMLIIVLGIGYMVSMRGSQISRSGIDWTMLFLGAGFMLLETTMMSKIALLIGATWTVNTFVIGALLTIILFANLLTAKLSSLSIRVAFSGIMTALLINWFFETGTVPIFRNTMINVVVSLLVLGLPAFFAAVAFAKILSSRPITSAALGYNLFGAMIGGVLEYFSTLVGINNLLLICLAVYACAAISYGLRRQTLVPADDPVFSGCKHSQAPD